MKLIVGLGNPGIEYQFTPHNIGFLALDRVAERCGVRIANRRCHALTGGYLLLDFPDNVEEEDLRSIFNPYDAR